MKSLPCNDGSIETSPGGEKLLTRGEEMLRKFVILAYAGSQLDKTNTQFKNETDAK